MYLVRANHDGELYLMSDAEYCLSVKAVRLIKRISCPPTLKSIQFGRIDDIITGYKCRICGLEEKIITLRKMIKHLKRLEVNNRKDFGI